MKKWLTFSSSRTFWLSFLFGIPFILWLWAIGTELSKKAPENLNLNVRKFKTIMLFIIAYMVFAVIYILIWNDVIFLLHLAAMACILYAMLFAAKIIKAAELQKNVIIDDYISDFFLIWFYPIGIWYLQPRINKLIAGTNAID